MDKNIFEFCYVIGKGGFGKVWKIKHKKTQKYYALKEMSKIKIIEKKSEHSINCEREFLTKLYNPFIVNMYYAFQDSDNLYLVLDYLKGGDLRFHLTRHLKFSEEQSRFFICNVLISLEYIHSKEIIHRDIKPENLVLDDKGYARITDFGIAKKNFEAKKNKGDTSGTPGYMAPEVMMGVSHSYEVDFFAVGIISYEFMKGKRPYDGKNRKEIKEEILMKQIEIKEDQIPEDWTKESVDFINKLLVRKKENRLGYNGIKEVKEHPWIKYYPWEMVENKTLPSPFIPQNKDNFDLRFCAKTEKIGQDTKIRYEEILMGHNYKNIFKLFYYNYEIERKSSIKKSLSNINNKTKINKSIYRENKPQLNRRKIIIDITKDKYNTINEEINNNKKIENKTIEENLFINIFKKQNLRRKSSLFEQKIKNYNMINKSKGKSNSNIISHININKSMNCKIEKRNLNISSILSPAKSERNAIKNKENNASSIIYKTKRQRSNLLSGINNIKFPTFRNDVENKDKAKAIKASNKCSSLLTKSNSYKMKSTNVSKKQSINFKNRNKRNILINSNLTSNFMSSKNVKRRQKINLSNGNIKSPTLLPKEGKIIFNPKPIIYRNDLIKNKISNTINNINSTNSTKNNNLNKTFFNDLKSYKIKYIQNNENIPKNIKYIPLDNKKDNNKKIKINDTVKAMIKFNPKIKNLYESRNIIDKENININLNENLVNVKKNTNNKYQMIKTNDDYNKERICVNKKNKNKLISFDREKQKTLINSNNSIISTKNSYIYKYYKNKMNYTFKTLNSNGNALNSFGKEGAMTHRNANISFKLK